MNWLEGILTFVAFVPCVVIHEVSHGFVANMLGDSTAKDRGRLSLNPLKHVDPFGTILLPVLLYFTAGFAFGYAKPVPVNPHRFRDYRRGFFLSSLAGPVSNLLMATAGGLVVRLLGLFDVTSNPVGTILWLFAYIFTQVNLVLMLFNIIPIPPLDGSRVIPLFLSDRGMAAYANFERYGMFVLFGLLLVGPSLGVDFLGGYFRATLIPLLRLLTGV